MKKQSLNKNIVSMVMALLLCVCVNQALAQKPITMTLQQALDFGLLASDNGTCSMNASGQLSGSGGQGCLGPATPAVFDARGAKDTAVVITAVGSTGNGVTFTPVIVGGASQVFDNRGGLIFSVVGSLQLNNPSVMLHALPYIVSVNYQ